MVIFVRTRADFVAMTQSIDWLWYSDAGEEFATWGVEGTTYTKDASGKRKSSAGASAIVVGRRARGG